MRRVIGVALCVLPAAGFLTGLLLGASVGVQMRDPGTEPASASRPPCTPQDMAAALEQHLGWQPGPETFERSGDWTARLVRHPPGGKPAVLARTAPTLSAARWAVLDALGEFERERDEVYGEAAAAGVAP